MIKIALVVPDINFIENAKEIFFNHNEIDGHYQGEPYFLEEVVTTMDDVRNLKIEADVIISRGLFAQILKHSRKDVPVVEISLLISDIIQALIDCRQNYNPSKIGIMATLSVLLGTENFSELLGIPCQVYTLEPDGNDFELVKQAAEDGCNVIIGGPNPCHYAQMLHIDYVPLRTSRESLWQAISTAKNAARISRNEQEKSGRLEAILDASKEGILSVDQKGYVKTINKSALDILHLPLESLARQYIKDTILSEDFQEIIINPKEYSNKAISFRGSLLNLNKSLIMVKNDVAGAVVTFQMIENIQAVEYKLRKTIHDQGHIAKTTFDNITGNSSTICDVVERARGFSSTDSNILLIGGSGTGKELFAQGIHNYSHRKKAPFVAVNCAAIPETLLESELFGYVGGAFTGAAKGGKSGYFELAHKGTIFLDEIAEIPLTLQSKLLRVLQEREIMRLGDGRIIPVDIRIIAATNRDLEKLVLEDKFRQDLFFRLDVLRINLPPLNERREDIPLLVDSYLKQKFPGLTVAPVAMEILKSYNWYGNIRQLFNICERIAVLKQNEIITEQDVLSSLPFKSSYKLLTKQQEDKRTEVLNALIAAKYNRTLAAECLQINRSTLWRKMKEFNL